MLLKLKCKEVKQGEIDVSGSKNSAIAIICASILCDEFVTLKNVPDITDVNTLFTILNSIGYQVDYKNGIARINKKRRIKYNITDDDVKKMRGSYYFMGALLTKRKKVSIANTGGCNLGHRPINFHLDGFEKMGATITHEDDIVRIKSRKLYPCEIKLDFPSVGATINLMLASVKTDGITTIYNCAKEPEIVDVANFLNSMGAKVYGAGTKTISIRGVKRLSQTTYTIMPDRIEAGTYLILGALLKGVKVRGIKSEYLESLINLLRLAGYNVSCDHESITISEHKKPTAFHITVGTYPSFPTDLGQPLAVLATQIEGTSVIRETIFKKRYSHVDALNSMGAKIKVVNDNITIEGITPLTNSTVEAHDLRGGAALMLAGCLSKSETTIENIDVLLRGYENPVHKLRSFGIEAYLVYQEN